MSNAQVRKTPLPSKIVIVGDAQVGKTTYIKRLVTGEFEKKYEATMGCVVHPVDIEDRTFNVWEIAGVEKFRPLEASYYTKAVGAIVMYSVIDSATYKNVKNWIDMLKSVGIKNIVVVANKIDVRKKPAFKKGYRPSTVAQGNPSCILSSRSMYNFELPFQLLSTMIGRESVMEYNPFEGIKEMMEAA